METTNTQAAIDRSIDKSKEIVSKNLKRKSKVVTKKTINSLKRERTKYGTNLKVGGKLTAAKSLLFIESGRRKGAKLPVRKVNGKFELFPDLALWKRTLGVTIPDFALAKGISERGIKPTPIIKDMVQEINPFVRREIVEAFGKDVVSYSVLGARNVFKN